MAYSFHVKNDQYSLRWSNAVPPILTVASGSEVSFDLRCSDNNQIRPDNVETAMREFDIAQVDPVFGLVRVEGVEPGNVLAVEFLALTPGPYGWTGIFPGFGLLADDFPQPQLKK